MCKIIFKILFLILFTLENLQAWEFIAKDNLISILKTKDNSSIIEQKSLEGNVIQGIANFKDFWITTQTSNNKFLIINFLDEKGNSIFNQRINYPSHGQDLSIEYIKEQNILKLYTVSTDWKGLVSFDFKIEDEKISYLESFNEINLQCKHCTSTLDTTENFFAVKDVKDITIYDKNISLENNKENAIITKFKLNPKQTIKGQHFQGIEMRNNLIYCLTSSEKIDENKYLFVYDMNGKVVYFSELIVGKDFAIEEGDKYELEGLTFKDNALYTTVMTGKKGKNIKRLYKILEVN